MANPKHLAVLKKGVDAWNRWRDEHPRGAPNLSNADLIGAKLSWAHLDAVNITRANLQLGDLFGADLRFADLRGVNLREANLRQVDLLGANLCGADFSEANLLYANLSDSLLIEADFTGVRVGYTTFANVDLSDVKGLETVDHRAPSSIGIDTIYKSKGKIPHIFLRGCGVPEIFITYMESLVSQAVEFYSLFISHSSKNKDFAQKLHDDLQSNGVRCWLDNEDMKGGRKLEEQIDKAIRSHERMLLVISPESIASPWVGTEIAKARKIEVEEGRQVLFPIRLCGMDEIRSWKEFDADIGKDSAREIREYLIPDFSDWKNPASYQKAFEKLLRDLKGDPKPISI